MSLLSLDAGEVKHSYELFVFAATGDFPEDVNRHLVSAGECRL